MSVNINGVTYNVMFDIKVLDTSHYEANIVGTLQGEQGALLTGQQVVDGSLYQEDGRLIVEMIEVDPNYRQLGLYTLTVEYILATYKTLPVRANLLESYLFDTWRRLGATVSPYSEICYYDQEPVTVNGAIARVQGDDVLTSSHTT